MGGTSGQPDMIGCGAEYRDNDGAILVCTRLSNHDGNHIAHDAVTNFIWTGTRDDRTERPIIGSTRGTTCP